LARLGPANVVTGARALLVALLAATALEPAALVVGWWVVVTATVTASLDLADGWLARRTGLTSAFGARFDMEVDALLVLVLSALVWRTGRVGAWVLLAGLLRYLFLAAAVVLPWMARALPPSRRRQAICVVQITALIIALAPIVPAPASVSLCAVSLALLAWSFWVDVAWLVARRGSASNLGD
jgi:phosphatidylglycerophosphate synthase